MQQQRPTGPRSEHGSHGTKESGGSGDIRRVKTRLIDEISQEFQSRGIAVGDPHIEEQKPPGTSGAQLKVISNVYGVKMANVPVFRYDITISALFGGRREGKRIEFTKRSKEDSVIVDRKKMCRVVFKAMVAKHQDVFGDEFACFYDLQCILVTMQELDLGPKDEHVFELDRDDCANVPELQRFAGVEMLARKVRDAFQLTLGDLSHLTNDTTAQNHSLASFIELATSQSPLFNPDEHLILGGGKNFLLKPEHYGFTQEDSPNLSDSKYLAVGAHKSVRYVEGPRGRENRHVGLIVETKKTPFHISDQTLMEKAAAIIGPNSIGQAGQMRPGDISRLHSQFKLLHIEVRYGRRGRDVRVSGVKNNTARGTPLDVQGQQVSVEEYYKVKYDIVLRWPEAPLASALERGRTNFYPLEVCYVKDFQRAQLNQLNSREVATMIRACAVPPPILKRQTEKNVEALELHTSQYLSSAGIKITVTPLTAAARRLPNPVIQYRGGSIETNEDGKWQLKDSFVVPATCEKWAMYMIPGGTGEADRRNRFTLENLVSFSKEFVRMCQACGMHIRSPADIRQINSTVEEVEQTMQICRDEKCDLVFFVTADAITNLHNVIKSCEQRYQVLTQDLKMNNAFEITTRGKRDTMRNIVCKTNQKLGGLNYTVIIKDPATRSMIESGTLVIGLGVSHAGAMGNYERARGAVPDIPSVIGYAANMKPDPFDFVGDYVFDEPRRDEKFSTVATIVTNCIERFRKNRNQDPTRVIMYRNGTSEGQYGMALQYEVPLIKHALQGLDLPECKLTVLVSQKAHNIRLFTSPMPEKTEISLPNGRTKKLNVNIKPGTGTARTPRYTVLLDESKFPMDMIESFTYGLSYAHQIINSPTSLPSPAYIALLYAKRGRALFNEAKRAGYQIPYLDNEAVDFQGISETLSYSTTILLDQRVNA
ncbi:piwi domain-containing protein [Ditylenchus destructor]|uniref:Piwi domain-containing protein n=1 Tax=Ditylenchus destructor TaxID=166010 RepID=A0AAD4N5D2_9BILA|nr:piwi domain-containing protein [Ditylenchus destructor]